MPRTPTVTDIPFESIKRRFQLASYYFGSTWCPAVDMKDGGWRIRVLKSETRTGSNVNTTYDYFYLDETGLITTSPRGHAVDYTKRRRVSDIAEVAKRYEEPDPAALRIRL